MAEEPQGIPQAYVPICDHGMTRVGKIVRYGRWWAVKSLSEDCPDSFMGKSLIEKEFQILISLSHPNVIRATELVDIPPLGKSMVMEFVEGCDLTEWLEGKPSQRERRDMARQIVDTFAYLHSKGVAHRDVKPENLMVDSGGNLKVIDFGLADRSDFAYIKHVTGTPSFAAPELAGDINADAGRADIYSIGKVLDLLSPGRAWRRVIKRAVSADPEARPSNAVALQRLHRRASFLSTGLMVLGIVSLLSVALWALYPKATGDADTYTDTVSAESREVSVIAPRYPARTPEESAKDFDTEVTKEPPADKPRSGNVKPAAAPDVAPSKDEKTDTLSPTSTLIVGLIQSSYAWDAEKRLAREEHRDFNFDNVRKAVEDLRGKGVRSGWGDEELKVFDERTSSDKFREKGYIGQ